MFVCAFLFVLLFVFVLLLLVFLSFLWWVCFVCYLIFLFDFYYFILFIYLRGGGEGGVLHVFVVFRGHLNYTPGITLAFLGLFSFISLLL